MGYADGSKTRILLGIGTTGETKFLENCLCPDLLVWEEFSQSECYMIIRLINFVPGGMSWGVTYGSVGLEVGVKRVEVQT